MRSQVGRGGGQNPGRTVVKDGVKGVKLRDTGEVLLLDWYEKKALSSSSLHRITGSLEGAGRKGWADGVEVGKHLPFGMYANEDKDAQSPESRHWWEIETGLRNKQPWLLCLPLYSPKDLSHY